MATEVADIGPETKEGFIRGLGLLDSTMIVAGSMIGSGIFIVSADISRQVGAPGWLLVVWIITGLLTFVAAIGWPAQLAIFAVLSIALVLGSHYLPKRSTAVATSLNQRTDQIVGRTAVVAEDFRNGQGAVTVGDTRWSAQSVDGSDLTAGTRVEVVAAHRATRVE